ncbi:MAG: hypothetical protein ACREV6_06060 [Clostridium sp.]|uniref:hypothetical protein n=1 Tax=Clostridium sp. TaxID=1506 RepID=UPI003D6CA585
MDHWYALDIQISIDNITEDMQGEQVEPAINQFIKGYRCEYTVSNDMLKLLPIFRRYDNLSSYVRLLLSIKEKWNNEPAWMVDLRIHLENSLNNKKCIFTKSI